MAMYCSNCGTKVNEWDRFCITCGQVISQIDYTGSSFQEQSTYIEPQSIEQSTLPQYPYPSQQGYIPVPEVSKKKSNAPIIIIGIVVLVIGVTVVGYITGGFGLINTNFFKSRDNADPNEYTNMIEGIENAISGMENANEQKSNEENPENTNSKDEEKDNVGTSVDDETPPDESEEENKDLKWPDNEYTKGIPIPNFEIIDIQIMEEEDLIIISFVNVEINQLQEYAEKLKAVGFTTRLNEYTYDYAGSTYYSFNAVRNEDGYEATLMILPPEFSGISIRILRKWNS